jgi:hypothetical protein
MTKNINIYPLAMDYLVYNNIKRCRKYDQTESKDGKTHSQ